ncbi:MAG: Sir2 family NAD-dependent protein deacetylase [Thermodesulfobacteriota bacterium]
MHERSGSRDVLHLHGTLRQMRCMACGRRRPSFHRAPEVPPLPACDCVGRIRPDVVWFGEFISADVLQRAFDEAARSDVMIVAGTSAVVHPAASLPLEVRRHGGTVIEINPDTTPLSSMADFPLRMEAGIAFHELVGILS